MFGPGGVPLVSAPTATGGVAGQALSSQQHHIMSLINQNPSTIDLDVVTRFRQAVLAAPALKNDPSLEALSADDRYRFYARGVLHLSGSEEPPCISAAAAMALDNLKVELFRAWASKHGGEAVRSITPPDLSADGLTTMLRDNKKLSFDSPIFYPDFRRNQRDEMSAGCSSGAVSNIPRSGFCVIEPQRLKGLKSDEGSLLQPFRMYLNPSPEGLAVVLDAIIKNTPEHLLPKELKFVDLSVAGLSEDAHMRRDRLVIYGSAESLKAVHGVLIALAQTNPEALNQDALPEFVAKIAGGVGLAMQPSSMAEVRSFGQMRNDFFFKVMVQSVANLIQQGSNNEKSSVTFTPQLQAKIDELRISAQAKGEAEFLADKGLQSDLKRLEDSTGYQELLEEGRRARLTEAEIVVASSLFRAVLAEIPAQSLYEATKKAVEIVNNERVLDPTNLAREI